ncbi:MAG: tRNA lysidine(34) synthetase TilS [Candidatus Aminicenantaceae bacterium]
MSIIDKKIHQLVFDTFKKTILKYGLLRKKDKVLVCCSGGKDSTALLYLFLELKKEWDINLSIAHFNHRLRPEARRDEQFVKDCSLKFSLPFYSDSEDVLSYAESHRMNIEEAGRKLRYNFFKKTAREIEAAKIATGHTKTDQAETVLMRILRGSGLQGLAGIYPELNDGIIRPLIHIAREEIDDYMKNKKISFCTDKSNYDRSYLRNKVRLDLIPELQKKYDSRIVSNLAKMASIIKEENDLLEQIVKESMEKAILRDGDKIKLDALYIQKISLALARRVVRNFIVRIKGDLRGVSFDDIETILGMEEGKEFSFKNNLILKREENFIFLKVNLFEAKSSVKKEFKYFWNMDTKIEIKEINQTFIGRLMNKEDTFVPRYGDENRAYLDRAKICFPIIIRPRIQGDKYQPLGSPGKKKLKEIMRAKGIPRSKRDILPVFFSGDDILWVPGLPVSEKFKWTNKTKEIYLIERIPGAEG